MGNIAFITTKKHIKSYNVLEILQFINREKFDSKFIIEKGEGSSWHIKYDGDWPAINFYCHGARKIGNKHPPGSWWSYIMYVFHNEFAVITNGILSDECCPEKWYPEKDKYKCYADYLTKSFDYLDAAGLDYVLKVEMKSCPKGMEKY